MMPKCQRVSRIKQKFLPPFLFLSAPLAIVCPYHCGSFTFPICFFSHALNLLHLLASTTRSRVEGHMQGPTDSYISCFQNPVSSPSQKSVDLHTRRHSIYTTAIWPLLFRRISITIGSEGKMLPLSNFSVTHQTPRICLATTFWMSDMSPKAFERAKEVTGWHVLSKTSLGSLWPMGQIRPIRDSNLAPKSVFIKSWPPAPHLTSYNIRCGASQAAVANEQPGIWSWSYLYKWGLRQPLVFAPDANPIGISFTWELLVRATK